MRELPRHQHAAIRETASEPVAIPRRCRREFRHQQGSEFKDGHTASERFTDMRHQRG